MSTQQRQHLVDGRRRGAPAATDLFGADTDVDELERLVPGRAREFKRNGGRKLGRDDRITVERDSAPSIEVEQDDTLRVGPDGHKTGQRRERVFRIRERDPSRFVVAREQPAVRRGVRERRGCGGLPVEHELKGLGSENRTEDRGHGAGVAEEPGEQPKGAIDEPRRIGVAAGGERLFHLCEVAGRERDPPAEAAVALLDAPKAHKGAEQTGPEQTEADGRDRCARGSCRGFGRTSGIPGLFRFRRSPGRGTGRRLVARLGRGRRVRRRRTHWADAYA